MKTQKGITLIMLVITIIVLAILIGVAVNVGVTTYKNAEIASYVATMNMIQSRVNVINAEIKQGDTSYNSAGIALARLNSDTLAQINTALNGESQNGFKYFGKEQLAEIGLSNIDEKVIINFETTEIFSLVPIEYQNTQYYNQYNLPNGVQVVDYTELVTVAPTFTLTKDNYGLTATINITNIVYDPQINGSNIYYAEVTDNTTTPVTIDYWRNVSGTSFTVDKTAEYAVKLVDRNGGEAIRTIKIVTCNSPEIVTGMIPVVYDEVSGNWKKVDNNNMGQWYDYAEKKWANVMLSDGTQIAQDGTITTMGSMFVWIPRYAYSITSGYQQGGDADYNGTIEIKFLKETSNITTDETSIRFSEVAGQNNWIIHPVFRDGSQNNYAEGGWDKEISGFWVAKFEASGLTGGNTGTAVGNASAASSTPVAPTANTIIKVLPNVISWRHISIGDSQYRCMQMAGNTTYGWTANTVDTHLIKNDEWGAVAYLCYSPYGSVPMTNGAGVSAGSYYYNMYTGAGSQSSSSEEMYTYDSNHAYNTELGVLASTTGNEYGVYDMAGGAWDRVAAYLNNKNDRLNSNGNSTYTTYFTNNALNSVYAKYWNRYEVSNEERNNAIVITRDTETGEITEQKTQAQLWSTGLNEEKYNSARLRITTEIWNNMALCRGIGMNEVAGSFSYYGVNKNNSWGWYTNTTQPTVPISTYGRAWDSDSTLIGNGCTPFVIRGGYCNHTTNAGVFCTDIAEGSARNRDTFRPALIVNM